MRASRLGRALRGWALGVVMVLSVAGFGEAQQRTMGFTRRWEFPWRVGTNLHWISIPWKYHPVDVGTTGVLDAEDLCQDLGGATHVGAVVRWDEATSTFVEHLCGSASPFALVKGEGYGVRNASGFVVRGLVAGAHDNLYSYSIAASGGSQLSWLSVPYHLRMPEKSGDLSVNAGDLCRQVGATELLAVVRWNNETSVFETYLCGSAFAMPFSIERGVAYGLVNRGAQTIDWQPIHY